MAMKQQTMFIPQALVNFSKPVLCLGPAPFSPAGVSDPSSAGPGGSVVERGVPRVPHPDGPTAPAARAQMGSSISGICLLATGFSLVDEVFHIQNLNPFSFISDRPLRADLGFCDVRTRRAVHTQKFGISEVSKASCGSRLN